MQSANFRGWNNSGCRIRISRIDPYCVRRFFRGSRNRCVGQRHLKCTSTGSSAKLAAILRCATSSHDLSGNMWKNQHRKTDLKKQTNQKHAKPLELSTFLHSSLQILHSHEAEKIISTSNMLVHNCYKLLCTLGNLGKEKHSICMPGAPVHF